MIIKFLATPSIQKDMKQMSNITKKKLKLNVRFIFIFLEGFCHSIAMISHDEISSSIYIRSMEKT